MSAKKKDTAVEVDPFNLAFLTSQVRNHLAFHQEMGLNTYPSGPKLEQFLARVPRQQRRGQQENHSEHSQPVAPVVPHAPPAHHPGKSSISLQTLEQQLEAFNQEIVQCCCCSSGSSIRKKILGQGGPRPRLCVLGDYFLGTPKDTLLWGQEEDAMLWRMMQAIGLEQEAVYVTNAIKCPQPAFVQSGSPQAQACSSRMEKELQIIQPEVICVMGDTALQILLKTKAPLVRLRGKFHTYRYLHGGTVKIMPTYHPRLLVQYPEMKMATWKDLQAVQRFLQTRSPDTVQ
ncbi:MAG: hypothetical protein D3920_03730 [Candidatus Electrothrix sp. AW2]|nr:hypothetical protein [Candidatus Electrothrix gigas]